MCPLQPNEFSTCNSCCKALGVVIGDQHVVSSADDERLVPQASKVCRTVEIEQHPDAGRRDRQRRERFAGRFDSAAKIGCVCIHPRRTEAKYVCQQLVGAGKPGVEQRGARFE